MALVDDERERGYGELELAREQMDRDEERLAKIMSDFDMLCTHRDALARACQVLEEEERVHLRRLERLDLLVQLRALQQSQPWSAQQQSVVQESRQRGGAPLTAHGTRDRTPHASVSDSSRGKHASAHADGKVPRAAAGQGSGSRQTAGQAAPLQRGDEPAVGAAQASQHQVPAGCLPPLPPPAREPEGQHREGQHDSQPQEKMRPDKGQDGTHALVSCSAVALRSAKDASSASQPSAPGATPDATSVQGEVVADEPQRAAKRAKINPMRFLCKFQLQGQCRDPSCADLHLDSPPRVRQVADAACGGDEVRVEQGGAPSEGRVSGADAAAERVGVCGEMDAEQHAGASLRERVTAAGSQQREGGDSVLAEPDAVWPDFVAFSPLHGNLASRSVSSDTPVHSVPCGGMGAADPAALEAPAAMGQRRMEQEQTAEDVDISRLEQEWRATTEERYFGAMAQLGAARRKTTQEPGNIAAWLRLGQLLLQGGGGEGPESIRQDLALNALSNGLDANASSLDLWFAYLEVLQRKDGDEAVEMLQVAVHKVPLALSLWHRLASAQPSVELRLGVWQRAVQSAVDMLVSHTQHVDTPVRLAREWRPALAMWLQAQMARAAVLALALRPVEASRLLSRAASQLPVVLGINFDPYTLEGDRDGVQAVERAEGGARRGIQGIEWGVDQADKWRVALPVIETLCLLSVQVVSAGVEQHGSSSGPDVLLGRTPSTCFCDGGAGAELIVTAAAHSAHVSMQARSARQSPPWTYAAICLSSLTSRPNDDDESHAQRQQSFGDQKAVAIEAVEHASNLWQRCVESARHVGARCAESGVSAALAEHYVTLMRRASPCRGACTARQRILASFRPAWSISAIPQQCARHVDAPTAQEGVSVLVALLRDAVLMDSRPAVPRNGIDSKGLADEEVEWELDEEQEADDLQGGSKARDLIRLQQLARVACNRKLNPQSERSEQLKHAAQTAELGYWASRLTLITSTKVAESTASASDRSGSDRAACSEVQESLDAVRRGLVHVQALLASGGSSEAGQHSTGTEMDCGAGRVSEAEADVSADIAASLRCLLCQNAATSEPSKSSKEGQEQEVDTQEDGLQEVLCEDAAEEAMCWWWSRSIVWAAVLEWRIALLPRGPPRHLHHMSAQDADRLLAKCLDAVRKMEASGQACCTRCCDDAAGGSPAACYHLEVIVQQNDAPAQSPATLPSRRRLCQSSLLRLARAAVCAEWQHLVLGAAVRRAHARDMAPDTGCCLPKPAFLEILGQIKVEALAARLGNLQHAGEHEELGAGTGSAGSDGSMTWRQWRRYMAVAGAWDAVLLGDEADAARGTASHDAHTPGLLQLLLHEAMQSARSSTVASMARAMLDAAENTGGILGARQAATDGCVSGSLALAAATFVARLGADERGALLAKEDGERLLGLVQGLEGVEPVLVTSDAFWRLKMKLAHVAEQGKGEEEQHEGLAVLVQEQSMLEQACKALPESAGLMRERIRLLDAFPEQAAALRKSARKLGLNV